MPQRYDAVVIGAGQAGGPLAGALARAGRRVALVEREHVGGTCINEGCTPTKTMVASARAAHLARRAAEYGVRTGPVEVALGEVRRRKRDMVESFRAGSERRLADAGVEVVRGEGRFAGPRALEVALPDGGTRRLEGDLVFINVGARPAAPDFPLGDLSFLDSTSIMELDAVPDHLIVVGGGYIGLEFGQMFRRFGSRVTIVQRNARLLPQEDPDVSEEVRRVLAEDGLELLLESTPVRASRAPDGLELSVRAPDGERVLRGSHLLLAAGRTPNTDRLAAAAAGVELDARGFVRVNERLETNAPGVYALGDVKGGPAFTHVSYDDFRVIRTNLLEGGRATTADRLVPYTVFIDPQLGRVGLTETEARRQGRAVRVARMPMSHVARALEVGEPRGFMKAVVDGDSGRILGAAVLGLEGGELVAVLQLAMLGGVTYPVLRDAIFAHPTLAESLNNLFAVLDD